MLKKIPLSLLFFIGLSTGCTDHRLEQDVAPLADAMCRFIEIQHQLKAAELAGDSLAIGTLSVQQEQMTIEMTILNQEFQEKYADRIQDPDFGKAFKRSMNEAMIDCPCLSDQDRERIEGELGR